MANKEMAKLNHLEQINIHSDEIILPRTSNIDCEAYREDIINRKELKENKFKEDPLEVKTKKLGGLNGR